MQELRLQLHNEYNSVMFCLQITSQIIHTIQLDKHKHKNTSSREVWLLFLKVNWKEMWKWTLPAEKPELD